MSFWIRCYNAIDINKNIYEKVALCCNFCCIKKLFRKHGQRLFLICKQCYRAPPTSLKSVIGILFRFDGATTDSYLLKFLKFEIQVTPTAVKCLQHFGCFMKEEWFCVIILVMYYESRNEWSV